MFNANDQKHPLLLTRDEACRLLGVKLSQYKILVGRGLLREVRIGERGRRLPLEEAFRFARQGVETKDSTTVSAGDKRGRAGRG
jgi:excisionase family DNA binding protein